MLLIGISALSIAGYLLGNWGFTLTRDPIRRAFHARRGALTTRETSIDVDRLRGVEVHQPLGLRLARAASLNAIVTGLARRSEGSSPIAPAAPRAVIAALGDDVLASVGSGAPLSAPLRAHGARARRRRHTRALGPVALVLAALAAACLLGELPWWALALGLIWLPLPAAVLAEDRYAQLGHALAGDFLVTRSGTLQGRRAALQRSGIIGWNISQTFFQRRAGLATLTATTAAGRQGYQILDLPEEQAIALADESVPGLLEQFLDR